MLTRREMLVGMVAGAVGGAGIAEAASLHVHAARTGGPKSKYVMTLMASELNRRRHPDGVTYENMHVLADEPLDISNAVVRNCKIDAMGEAVTLTAQRGPVKIIDNQIRARRFAVHAPDCRVVLKGNTIHGQCAVGSGSYICDNSIEISTAVPSMLSMLPSWWKDLMKGPHLHFDVRSPFIVTGSPGCVVSGNRFSIG